MRIITICILMGWGGLSTLAGFFAKTEAGWLFRVMVESLKRVMLRTLLLASVISAIVITNGYCSEMRASVPDLSMVPEGIIEMPKAVGSEPVNPAFTYRVVKRSAISQQGTAQFPIGNAELIALNIWPDKAEVSFAGSKVMYEINEPNARVSNAAHPENGLVPAIKGYRVAVGGSIEQIVITESSIMLIVPSGSTNCVTVTYAEAEKGFVNNTR